MIENSDTGSGFSLEAGTGLDVLLAQHFAIGFGTTFHPGFTEVAQGGGPVDLPKVSYAAFHTGLTDPRPFRMAPPSL